MISDATGKSQALLSWSSGKDSAFALAVLREENALDVVGLVTTINAVAHRVAMHAVREDLLRLQAKAIGLPVWRIDIPSPCSNEEYEIAMARLAAEAVEHGITHMAFGDLFLTDVRAYREEQLCETGITPIFPLWKRNSTILAHEMLASGVKAVVTCVDPKQVSPSFVGREFDAAFLAELSATCDPCGENGEFHTFTWDGPAFGHAVPISVGEIVERDGFVFADVVSVTERVTVGGQ